MNYELYRGPSMIDGQPIVAIVSGVHRPSQNEKTGPMIQVTYLRSDMHPIEAIKTGADESICGNCIHRGINGEDRSCYVQPLISGPGSLFKTIDQLKPVNRILFRHRAVRLGLYGNPTSIPYEAHEPIIKEASLITGYAHDWRTCDQRYRNILMASVDTEEERDEAKAMGWSTFRVKQHDEPMLAGELMCPASDEAGKALQCITCGACNGAGARDRAINVHGSGQKHFKLLTHAEIAVRRQGGAL